MFTKEREWNYEQPKMTYDKETGDVTIHKTSQSLKKKRIIRSYDDVQKMKKDLDQEMGLEDDGLPGEEADLNSIIYKIKNVRLRELEEVLDLDPSLFYAFTSDMMRIDVGLMIQRPPIFLRFRERDIDFVKDRTKLMNEYYMDHR